jgi:hypothetical protein
MSIGIGLGISLASRRRAPFLPSTLAGLDFWARDDDPDATITSSAYVTIPNRGSLGGTTTQATGANQAAESTLNSLPAKLFDGSNDFYASSLASSTYIRYHDGSPSTLVCVARFGANANQLVCGTFDTNPNLVGFALNYNGGANQRVVFRVSNGTGTHVLTHTLTTGDLAADTTAVISVRWEKGRDGDDLSVRINGASVGTGNFTEVDPSTGNPSFTFRWGHSTNSIQGYGPEKALYSRFLPDSELEAVEAYMAAKWGATLA